MNKYVKLLLCLSLCLCLSFPVLAEETPKNHLTISTTEEFLTFTESCRLDSYSQNLTVSLEADIDLSGTDFAGIPIFCGTLEGGGHTVSGLNLTGEGSVQGLFRYLTETAIVRELTVEGTVVPQGSRTIVGGIAGSNAGTLERVRFRGDVAGSETVGGLVGINTLTGVIENGYSEGTVHGTHFVGGIAGQNSGALRLCENTAQINTTPQQNTIGLSDITMDTLTDSESANTVTDIGGIAGTSTGVLRRCINRGAVGYRQMGYNIGGIAGSQSGYITGCVNHASVSGRKEVGGIVGHMEPAILLEYSEDTLQQLQTQLDTISSLADRAAGSAQTGADSVREQLGLLQEQVDTARSAVDSLLPDLQDPQLPDADSVLAAQNSLSGSLSAIPGTLEGISTSTQSTASTLTRDIQALAEQLEAMEQTLDNAGENLNASVYDASDADTAETLTGKVAGCRNTGSILSDLNAGGIAGAIALENDLDPEADIAISGSTSLNFEGQLRSVILECKNAGTVTVLKQNAGGIVGWQSMGLVKGCSNSGSLDAENASYVGGIAGQSSGYIRNCFSTCSLSADVCAGGIAGSGSTVTDCRAMTALSGTEKTGAILGQANTASQEQPIVAGNYYLPIFADPGGIDGISYATQAEPLAQDAFLALEELPVQFRQSTVTFHFEDGTEEAVIVPCGEPLTNIPALPEKSGYGASWEGLDTADLSAVYFDMDFNSLYTAHDTVIASEAVRQERPVLLVQGDFTSTAAVTAQASAAAPTLQKGQQLLESWQLTVTGGTAHTARFLLPEDADTQNLCLLLQAGDGSWQAVDFTVSSSYLVFALANDTQGFALLRQDAPLWPWFLVGGAVLILLITATVLLTVKKRRKK